MSLRAIEPMLPATNTAVLGTKNVARRFDGGFDDATDILFERHDDIRQFTMKAVALGTVQTSDPQALAFTPAVVNEPVTPIPIPQYTTTDGAGDNLPAPD